MENLENLEGLNTPKDYSMRTEDFNYLLGIENLQPEKWSVVDNEARLNALNDLEGRMAEMMRRSPFEVVSTPETIPDGRFAEFCNSKINVNENQLTNPENHSNIVDGVINTGRSAYFKEIGLDAMSVKPDIHVLFDSASASP